MAGPLKNMDWGDFDPSGHRANKKGGPSRRGQGPPCFYCGSNNTPHRVVPQGWVAQQAFKNDPRPCCEACYRRRHTFLGILSGPLLLLVWFWGCVGIAAGFAWVGSLFGHDLNFAIRFSSVGLIYFWSRWLYRIS